MSHYSDELRQRSYSTLAGAGGGAWFIMDDGYAAGPPGEVLRAVQRFAGRMEELGLVLQFGKCSYFSPGGLSDADSAAVETLGIRPGSIVADGGATVFGITVGGIPLGSAPFVQAYVRGLAAGFESYLQRTVSQLQPMSNFAVWSCLTSALNSFKRLAWRSERPCPFLQI